MKFYRECFDSIISIMACQTIKVKCEIFPEQNIVSDIISHLGDFKVGTRDIYCSSSSESPSTWEILPVKRIIVT